MLHEDSRTGAHRTRAKELFVTDVGDCKRRRLGRRMGLFVH